MNERRRRFVTGARDTSNFCRCSRTLQSRGILARKPFLKSLVPEDGDQQSGPPAEPADTAASAGARTDRVSRLLLKARALPPVPGVYLMKDRAGVVVYGG